MPPVSRNYLPPICGQPQRFAWCAHHGRPQSLCFALAAKEATSLLGKCRIVHAASRGRPSVREGLRPNPSSTARGVSKSTRKRCSRKRRCEPNHAAHLRAEPPTRRHGSAPAPRSRGWALPDGHCHHGQPRAGRALARASSRGVPTGGALERTLRPNGYLLPGRHRAARAWRSSTTATAWTGRSLACPAVPFRGRSSVSLGDAQLPAPGLDQLVFYLPDAGASERITARPAAAGIHPVVQIDYWQANGGVTYQDPDGREVVFGVLDLTARPRDSSLNGDHPPQAPGGG